MAASQAAVAPPGRVLATAEELLLLPGAVERGHPGVVAAEPARVVPEEVPSAAEAQASVAAAVPVVSPEAVAVDSRVVVVAVAAMVVVAGDAKPRFPSLRDQPFSF